jgi:hypothetical protein
MDRADGTCGHRTVFHARAGNSRRRGRSLSPEREDGWEVDGIVLAKEPPYRLRVTWRIKTLPDLAMPNCEVEYLIEPGLITEAKSTAKLTVYSYFDGPLPPPFLSAGRTGWAMITRNLKEYLDEYLKRP